MRLLTTKPMRTRATSLGLHARMSSRDDTLRPCCRTRWKSPLLRRRTARLSATLHFPERPLRQERTVRGRPARVPTRLNSAPAPTMKGAASDPLRTKLDSQFPAPFGAAGFKHTTTVAGRHALHKPMFTFARNALRLPGSFHRKPCSPPLLISCRL